MSQPSSASTVQPFNASTWLTAVAVTLGAGLLYFLTAARDIVVGDSPELIIAAVKLGLAHPPGYPLFTMLGHLFGLLPVGPIPFRVNLLSVVCDTVAVGVIFLTGFHLSRSRLAAALGTLILAFNPLFWSWSLVAEVFPLNNLLATLLIYFLVVWNDDPQKFRKLAAAAFVAGLAVANQQTIVLLGPAVCYLLWRHRLVLLAQPRLIIICAVAFGIGLLPYSYLFWAAARHPVWNWGGISSFSDVVAHVTRKGYGSFHLVGPELEGGFWWHRLIDLFISLGMMLCLFGLLGLIRAWRQHRWLFWFVLLGFVCTGPLFAIVTNLNLGSSPTAAYVLERFFLLSLVVVTPVVALGITLTADRIASAAPELPRPLTLVAGALAIVLVVQVLTNYRRIDQSRNHIARIYAEDLFATVDPEAIVLVTGDGHALPLLYLQIVENVRPDVTLIVPPLLPGEWYVSQLRHRDPQLKIPFDYYDGQQNDLRALVDANPSRPIAYIGAKFDRSLDQAYQAYPFGVFDRLLPKSRRIDLGQVLRDNEELLTRLRPPARATVNPRSFEGQILLQYVNTDWRIGSACQSKAWNSEAIKWYRRALALDPNSSEARAGLARVEGEQQERAH
jgi:hypothetical protein